MRVYNNWDVWYERILHDFNFSKEKDEQSADILNSLIQQKGKFNMDDVDLSDKCIIFGAGPSLNEHIRLIIHADKYKNHEIIAADGASTALLENGIIPKIIVTDLDGKLDSIIQANKKGSILFVHAHGDNIDKIRKYVPLLDKIIPTTQSTPHNLLENYGGFTDGDRAVHIACYKLKMKEIVLAGMDFGEFVTKYSRPEIKEDVAKADVVKKLKLVYAEKLIDSINDNESVKIIYLKK